MDDDDRAPLEPIEEVKPADEAEKAPAAEVAAGPAADVATGPAVDVAAAAPSAPPDIAAAPPDVAAAPPPPPPPATPQPAAPTPPVYQPIAQPLGYRPPLQQGQPATGQQAFEQPPYGQQPALAYRADDYVSVGRRFLAILVDSILLGVVVGILAVPAGWTDNSAGAQNGIGVVLGLLMLVYYIGFEGSTGATLGKMALGIKVTMEDGSKATWGAAVVRNLLRIIDGIFSYLVGAILVWTSDKRQRLGDRLAKTVVVRTR